MLCGGVCAVRKWVGSGSRWRASFTHPSRLTPSADRYYYVSCSASRVPFIQSKRQRVSTMTQDTRRLPIGMPPTPMAAPLPHNLQRQSAPHLKTSATVQAAKTRRICSGPAKREHRLPASTASVDCKRQQQASMAMASVDGPVKLARLYGAAGGGAASSGRTAARAHCHHAGVTSVAPCRTVDGLLGMPTRRRGPRPSSPRRLPAGSSGMPLLGGAAAVADGAAGEVVRLAVAARPLRERGRAGGRGSNTQRNA